MSGLPTTPADRVRAYLVERQVAGDTDPVIAGHDYSPLYADDLVALISLPVDDDRAAAEVTC